MHAYLKDTAGLSPREKKEIYMAIGYRSKPDSIYHVGNTSDGAFQMETVKRDIESGQLSGKTASRNSTYGPIQGEDEDSFEEEKQGIDNV